MTRIADEIGLPAQPDRARPVPRARRKRDYALAAIVVVSVVIHATFLLPMLFTGKTDTLASIETPR